MTRTAVYIDGYNLYYGRLKGTSFKWLDIVEFSKELLLHRSQNETLEFVHLFTAPALARFATHGQDSVIAQNSYIRALETKHGALFKYTYGKHSVDKNGTPLPTYVQDVPFDKNNRTKVWLIEEKKTDVNIAMEMYRDVSKGKCDRVILISNDSDAEPVLKAISEDFPHVMIGAVFPIRPPQSPNQNRRASGSLANYATWVKSSIDDLELQNAQLPPIVPKPNKKPIRKPTHW